MPVSTLTMRTFALGTKAAAESVTTPLTDPELNWEYATAALQKTAIANRQSLRDVIESYESPLIDDRSF
jgi:hypothetical protein